MKRPEKGKSGGCRWREQEEGLELENTSVDGSLRVTRELSGLPKMLAGYSGRGGRKRQKPNVPKRASVQVP